MIHTETSPNAQSANIQVTVTRPTYEEQLSERIAVKRVAEAKERGIPLWMLTGFPAVSDEADQDDPIDFL
jgi:hypothetical protein